MRNKLVFFPVYAAVFAFLGFLLDQAIMYMLFMNFSFPQVPGIAGIFSGLLPGLFLGLGISLAFKHVHKKLDTRSQYLFILTAGVGSFVGYVLADVLFRYAIIDNPMLASALGMIVPSLALVCGFHAFLHKLSVQHIVFFSLLGIAIDAIPHYVEFPDNPFLFFLFLVYPIAMATLLGWSISKKK